MLSKYKRNTKVLKHLKKHNGSIITSEHLQVIVPERFLKVGLLNITDVVEVVGTMLVVDNNNNASIMLKPNMVIINHNTIETFMVDDKPYYRINVVPGTFIVDTKTIISEDVVGKLLKEMVRLGNVPVYLNRDDIATIFLNAIEQGSKITNNASDVFAIVSVINRKDGKQMRFDDKPSYEFSGLSDIADTINTSMSLILGSYLDPKLTKLLSQKGITSSDLELIMQ